MNKTDQTEHAYHIIPEHVGISRSEQVVFQTVFYTLLLPLQMRIYYHYYDYNFHFCFHGQKFNEHEIVITRVHQGKLLENLYGLRLWHFQAKCIK